MSRSKLVSSCYTAEKGFAVSFSMMYWVLLGFYIKLKVIVERKCAIHELPMSSPATQTLFCQCKMTLFEMCSADQTKETISKSKIELLELGCQILIDIMSDIF